MGKRDDSTPRTTREFDSARLAALTKQPLSDKPASNKGDPDEVPYDESGPIALGRAATLADPLTTQLLAEVARRSQTADFDEELIQEVLEQIDLGDTTHPHTRRRTR